MSKIVTTLFPRQWENSHRVGESIEEEIISPITLEELMKACSGIGDSKAPGPDGIPNIALKTAVQARLDMFLDVYGSCLREGIFPENWKRQRLVLLPKGKKPPDDPSSYRPICMLDTAGKILERLIYNRLESAVERAEAEHQYGFRKARSTRSGRC